MIADKLKLALKEKKQAEEKYIETIELIENEKQSWNDQIFLYQVMKNLFENFYLNLKTIYLKKQLEDAKKKWAITEEEIRDKHNLEITQFGERICLLVSDNNILKSTVEEQNKKIFEEKVILVKISK